MFKFSRLFPSYFFALCSTSSGRIPLNADCIHANEMGTKSIQPAIWPNCQTHCPVPAEWFDPTILVSAYLQVEKNWQRDKGTQASCLGCIASMTLSRRLATSLCTARPGFKSSTVSSTTGAGISTLGFISSNVSTNGNVEGHCATGGINSFTTRPSSAQFNQNKRPINTIKFHP